MHIQHVSAQAVDASNSLMHLQSEKMRTVAAVDEVQWLHPAIPLELLWDDSLSSSSEASQTSILQGLLQQALTGPLLPAQQFQVLEQLQANPKRIFSCGLTPQRLPDLVELNPTIAIEVCCLLTVRLSLRTFLAA